MPARCLISAPQISTQRRPQQSATAPELEQARENWARSIPRPPDIAAPYSIWEDLCSVHAHTPLMATTFTTCARRAPCSSLSSPSTSFHYRWNAQQSGSGHGILRQGRRGDLGLVGGATRAFHEHMSRFAVAGFPKTHIAFWKDVLGDAHNATRRNPSPPPRTHPPPTPQVYPLGDARFSSNCNGSRRTQDRTKNDMKSRVFLSSVSDSKDR